MTPGKIEVSISDLRAALDLVLDHVVELHGTVIHLERDYFWSIPIEQLYNPYSEPDTFTVGQLSESISNVSGIARSDAPVNSFALVWVADVLRAVGQTLVL